MDFREYVRGYLPPLAVAREPEIVDELALHMADLYQEARSAGCDHETALARATAALPDAADTFANDLESASRALPGLIVDRWHAAHETASSRFDSWPLTDVLGELRIASRSLRRTPGVTAVIVLTLAIGIGATTAIYSVVDAVLINPLPYSTADRLQRVWVTNPQQEIDKDVTSYPTFRDWQAQATTFEALAAVTAAHFTLTGAGEPKLVPGERVTGRFFDLFGMPALHGRALQEADTEAGRERVLVLSHDFWQEHFGGDAAAVGRTVSVNAQPYDIVGVMPREFSAIHTAQAWAPLSPSGSLAQLTESRTALWLDVIGVLRRGVGAESAHAEMSAIMDQLAQRYPGTYDGQGILLEPLKETVVADARSTLLLLTGAVVLVLLIVCANVAGLLVARLSARKHEVAVRMAVGAGRGHLIRQLLIESALLGTAGAVAGIALASWGLRVLLASRPADLPRAAEIYLSVETLVCAVGVAMLAALAFGLLPSVALLRGAPGGNLRDDARGSVSAAGGGLRRVLVVAEIALACILVTSAGLLARSFAAMQSDDLGFERERLFTMRLTLPAARYPTDAQSRSFFEGLIEKIEAVPGVERAGAMSFPMLSRSSGSASLRIEGAPSPAPGTPNEPVTMDVITPTAFDALGVPITRGRSFNSGDVTDGLPVVIVNEAFVRRFYPDQDPIGKRVTFQGFDTGAQPTRWLTIVGVAGDTRRSGFTIPVREELYFPLSQAGAESMYVFVRTSGPPESVMAPVRRAVWSLDPQLAIALPRTMQAVMAAAVAEERFRMTLVAGFAATAMLLAALGVYGVMAFTTTARLKEFGVRLALGATPRRLLLTVMRDGLLLAAAGLIVGLAAAVAAVRALRQMLYGISPFDPVTFGAMAAALLVVTALASFVPARRAMKVDPMMTLSR
jgi:putative ABC transport system permease protein